MKRFSILILALAGCSGGGGGGSDDPFFGGAWTGDLKVVSDPCGIGSEENGFTLTVNQNGSDVVADSENGPVYEGTVTSENSFLVARSFRADCQYGSTASVSNQFEFTNIDGDSALVTWRSVSHCDGSLIQCEQVNQGTFTRN